MKQNKKNTKKKNFIAENYCKAWNFIKESKKFIYIIILLFFFLALIGFFIPVPDSLSKEIMRMLEEIVKRTEGMSQFELIKFIFFNNLQSSFLGMVLGIFLGIFPIFFAAFNGYILGFVALFSVNAGGFSILWKLLPHGIFELPAVFISLGLGLRIGVNIFHPNRLKSFKNYIWEFARVLIYVIIPLLLIAAIIEGNLIFLAR